jgi:hypothetical protein
MWGMIEESVGQAEGVDLVELKVCPCRGLL